MAAKPNLREQQTELLEKERDAKSLEIDLA